MASDTDRNDSAPLSVSDNASLKRFNTFGVEASARRLVELHDNAAIDAALDACGPAGPALLLGGGSNLLLTRDIDGAVLRIASRGRRLQRDAGTTVQISAAAGEHWDGFVQWTLAQGWFGLENLSLIPGNAGAAPIQNIGAYGVELRERFHSLDAIHLTSRERRQFDATACAFEYRDSFFKSAQGRAWLVLDVQFRLTRQPDLKLDYGELRGELSTAGATHPTPLDVARAVSAIRRRKLPDPARLGNAGSFFKNPIVTPALAADLKARFPDLPVYPAQPGIKLAAGWLIDQCGWKGFRDGDAGVHHAHALVLVNHGQASGVELAALARRIQDSVRDRFGVMLEPEPMII